MTLLYNVGLQKLEQVEEDKVHDLVASGQYAPRKGAQMPVVAPDGEVGYIPSENAQSAFLQGFKYQTKAMSQAQLQAGIEAAKEQAFGTSTATALGAGALRGATFGLSDVAMRAVGGKDVAEGLLETRERQPVASTVGEVAGAIGSMATGLSPVSAVAGLGERVAGKVALESTAGNIAKEIMSKGAGSAVEGAFYGAGELLTETALGDPKLTAENAAMVFGGNVLGGGLIGGLIPGAAAGVSHMKDKLGKILVEDMNVPAKAMDAYGKLISFAKISDPEQQAALKHLAEPTMEGRARRELVFDLVANPNKASDYALSAVKEAADLGKWEAEALGSMREGVRGNLEKIKYTKNADKLSEVQSITDKLSSTIMEASEKSNRYAGGTAGDLTSVLDDLKLKASEAKNLADMHKAVHDSRMLLDDFFEGVRAGATPEAINTKKLIKKSRDEMTDMLRSEKQFPGFGDKFSDADAAFSEYLTAAKEFRKKFEQKVAAPGGFAHEVSRGKAASLVKNPLSDIAIEKQAVLDRMTNAIESMGSVSAKMIDDPASFDKLNQATQAMRERLARVQNARSSAILLDRLEAKTGRSMLASAVGAGLGGIAGEMGLDNGYLGVAAGIGGGALLANPKTIMTYLMRLERGNHMAANAIDEGARKMMGLSVPATVKGAVGGLYSARKIGISEVAKALREDAPDNEGRSDLELIKQRAAPLERIDELDSIVKNQHPLLDDIAPNVYANKVNSRRAALTFIKSKFPQDRGEMFAGESMMSTMQRISLNRSIAAAFNPAELVHEMHSGDVRPETVEAVRVVYPLLFQQVQAKVSELLTEPNLAKKLDRQQKQNLAKIIGVPTTVSTANIELLQKSWAAPEPEGAPQTGKSQMALAMQTDSEATAFRRTM